MEAGTKNFIRKVNTLSWHGPPSTDSLFACSQFVKSKSKREYRHGKSRTEFARRISLILAECLAALTTASAISEPRESAGIFCGRATTLFKHNIFNVVDWRETGIRVPAIHKAGISAGQVPEDG